MKPVAGFSNFVSTSGGGLGRMADFNNQVRQKQVEDALGAVATARAGKYAAQITAAQGDAAAFQTLLGGISSGLGAIAAPLGAKIGAGFGGGGGQATQPMSWNSALSYQAPVNWGNIANPTRYWDPPSGYNYTGRAW